MATLFDVIEHLLPGDDEAVCRELARVASRTVIITAANCTSTNANGEELHINRRPYEEWDALFSAWFAGRSTWVRELGNRVSQLWRIDL